MSAPALNHRIGQSSVTVTYGSIITLPVDVIVSSDDVTLSIGGGVSQAIRAAAGETVYSEAQVVFR